MQPVSRGIAFGLGLLVLAALSGGTSAQLRGHGGPVRALAVSPDGTFALSGSFDSSVIRWSLTRNAAEQVLRFHQSAVNAVAIMPNSQLVTGGEDGQVAIWNIGEIAPAAVLNGHTAPVAALAVSPSGKYIASASWDRTVRLFPTAGSVPQTLKGHQNNVNGVAFTPDETALISVGYDLSLRIWPLENLDGVSVIKTPAPLNAVAVARDGEIVAAGADGKVYFFSVSGVLQGTVEAGVTPIISLAVSPDGNVVAAAAIAGSVSLIGRNSRSVLHTLVGPGLPVWSVAFSPDGKVLFTGGTDRLVRRWDVASGEHRGGVVMRGVEDPLAKYTGDAGAEVYKACVACHTLSPGEGERAGPTLHGIFGRKIATLPGYNFSEPLKKMDIVWTPETVAKLFEVGPNAYTPGTKMPEQKIPNEADRKALIEFLLKTTK